MVGGGAAGGGWDGGNAVPGSCGHLFVFIWFVLYFSFIFF